MRCVPIDLDDVVSWFDHHEGFGVWVGAAASVMVALVAVGAIFLQRYLERRSRRRSLALSSLFKLRQIHSNMLGMSKNLDSQLARAKRLGLTKAWQFMEPLPNPPDAITFTTDEQELLFSLGVGKLFDGILLLAMFHNSELKLVAHFRARRLALTDLVPADMRGRIGSVELTPEIRRIVGPRAVELESMLESMKTHFGPDAATAGRALDKLRDLVAAKLKLKVPLQRAEDLLAKDDASRGNEPETESIGPSGGGEGTTG